MTTLVISTDAPAVAGPPQGHWTYADWEQLPDDGNRYEIIDGALYMTPAPSSFHQRIVQELVEYIGIPAKNQGLAFTFPALIGVIMPGCDPVQPDFVVILASRASIIRERRIMGVPDVIVEILSPGNTAYGQRVKHVQLAETSAAQPRPVVEYGAARAPAPGAPPTQPFGGTLTVSEDVTLTYTFS